MDTILITTVAALGITGFFLQLKNGGRFLHFFNLLTVSIVVLILSKYVDDTSQATLFSLIAVVALNYVAAQLAFLKRTYIRAVVPLISIISFLLLSKDQTINFLGEDFVSVNKFLVGGGIISVLAYEFGSLIIKVFKKLLKGLEEYESMTSILLLLMAVAAFMGSLASSSYGLMIVVAGFVSASFYRDDESHRFGISLLAFTTLPILLSLTTESSSNIVDGDVIQGLLVGAFSMYFIQKLWMSKSRSVIAIVLGYVIAFGVSFAILWSGTIFFKMGGMDAFVGVIVGVALVNLIVGKGFVASSILMLLLSGAFVIPQFMINEEQAEFEDKMMITMDGGVDQEGNTIAPPKILALSELVGKYDLLSDSSSVSFYLGEGGKTKGAFKKVSGGMDIKEDMSMSSLNITLAMSDFTTFVGARDESLRGSDYFNVDRFPKITYKAKGFVETQKNVYKVNGDFTMLGVTKKVEVILQRVEKDGRKIVIGSGEVDRTLFGMTPDASEGNVVGFNYQVELN